MRSRALSWCEDGIDVSEHYIAQAIKRLQVGDAGMRRMAEARKAGAEQTVML